MSVIRVGSVVRIIDPRPVIGVGYEITIHTFFKTIYDDPRVMAFAEEMGFDSHARMKLGYAVAGNNLRHLKRDGAKRQLRFGEEVSWRRGMVVERTVRYTGEYRKARECLTSWRGDEVEGYDFEYETPSLVKPCAHVLLRVQPTERISSQEHPWGVDASLPSDGWWFPKEHLQKVNKETR